MQGRSLTRREFLWPVAARLLAGLAAGGVGVGCRPPARGPGTGSPRARGPLGNELKIIQWSHFVPAYDQWFDGQYTKEWGDANNVKVTVDHIDFAQLPARASSEVASQAGHDLFWFLAPPPAFEDQVIDHAEVVEEVEEKVGKMLPMARRSVYNPKTKKYFGFSDTWAPDPVHYRRELWDQVEPGLTPDTWDDVVKAGPKLKEMGHPLGIGLSNDIDANMALMALMHSFGSYLQDEEARVAINSKSTIEALKAGAEIFSKGMTNEVFSWDARSNNEYLLAGKGSLIVNAISALRTIEKQKPDLAQKIALAPIPEGPEQRLGLTHVMGVYLIWKFAKNKEAAKKFLVDLAVNYREAFIKSKYYNFPSFPGAVPDLKELVAKDDGSPPAGKLAPLAGAERWSTNVGHPGGANAAVDEVFGNYLIPEMFARVARGEMAPEEAVRSTESRMQAIFGKWRDQKKI